MVLLFHFEAFVIQSFCISEFYTWSPVYLGEEDSSVIDIERPKPEHVYIK